ncbi:MAG TPA: hypothetical protein VFQ36_05425 [Ktedonobacteraceae bacterium]|nr:hypothetical protein [Ktedonobacteraceae bacterium]
MRASQIQQASQSGCCCLSAAFQKSFQEQWTGGRCYALHHHQPGCANSFDPYPPGRRHRRR